MNYHLDIIVICHFRAHFHIHFHAHFHAHFCTHFCAHFDKVLREYPHFCLVGFLYILITDFTPTYQVPNRARVTSISWLFCGLLETRISRILHRYSNDERPGWTAYRDPRLSSNGAAGERTFSHRRRRRHRRSFRTNSEGERSIIRVPKNTVVKQQWPKNIECKGTSDLASLHFVLRVTQNWTKIIWWIYNITIL